MNLAKDEGNHLHYDDNNFYSQNTDKSLCNPRTHKSLKSNQYGPWFLKIRKEQCEPRHQTTWAVPTHSGRYRDYLARCTMMQWMFVVEMQGQVLPATIVKATPDGTFEAVVWNGQHHLLHPCLLPSQLWRNREVPEPQRLPAIDPGCMSYIVPSDLHSKLPRPWCGICGICVGSSSKELKQHEQGHQGLFNCLDCNKKCKGSADLRRHSRRMSHRIPIQPEAQNPAISV